MFTPGTKRPACRTRVLSKRALDRKKKGGRPRKARKSVCAHQTKHPSTSGGHHNAHKPHGKKQKPHSQALRWKDSESTIGISTIGSSSASVVPSSCTSYGGGPGGCSVLDSPTVNPLPAGGRGGGPKFSFVFVLFAPFNFISLSSVPAAVSPLFHLQDLQEKLFFVHLQLHIFILQIF